MDAGRGTARWRRLCAPGNEREAARLLAGDGFTAEGEVRLLGAIIGGQLNCAGGKFINPDNGALAADHAQITADVLFDHAFEADGNVSLRGTSAAALYDDQASWPEGIDLEGFPYTKLSNGPSQF